MKQTADVHTDSEQFGPKFTILRTIADFIRGSTKVNLGYEQSLAKLQNVFEGPLLTDWNHVLATNFPEPANSEDVPPEHNRSSAANFNRVIEDFLKRHLKEKKPRDRQYIYMAPGGDYGIHKDLMMSPMNHLHRFQEMLCIAELMPAGNIPSPNEALQVEWFYMTFHKNDGSEYGRSGRQLEDERIVSLAEYFECLFNAHLLDGTLVKKREEQIRQSAQIELHHNLEEHYKRKPRNFESSRVQHSANRNCERKDKSDRNHRGKSAGRTTGKDSRLDNRKAPPEGSAKKPCHLHGSGSKHSYSECRENHAKKHNHDAHHHDDCRHSSGEEEAYESWAGLAFSEGDVSASKSRNGTPAENYHLENYHIPKMIRTGDVGHKSPKKQTACGAVVKRTKKKDKKSSSSAKMASSSESKLNLEDFFSR